ncbi:uncharacterized protein NEMAJ01_0950 [Nematocida major]|uniref:uncharacterized protein n=1 Tax=Nematocida major TaxID=1912982 RepID=UPI0020075DAA|nr:uncharacterized protein NEMAJ01_0950 [Nematocida major]KAH9386054.1 hypothetical protein NEMAJ01_0950 [Nematocida major]
MSQSRRAEIIGRILKIRSPSEHTEARHIIKKGAERSAIFKRLVLSAPKETEKKVEYLIKNSKNEGEWEITCRAAEAFFEKTKKIEILDSILKAAAEERGTDCIASLFHSIKKLLILTWDSAETAEKIVKHAFNAEKQQYLAVAVSESLKVSQTFPAWLQAHLAHAAEEFKSYFLVNLLLDRNNHMHFDVDKYAFLYKLSDMQVGALMGEVAKIVEKSTLRKIVLYLAQHAESLSSLCQHFEPDTLVERINEIEPEALMGVLVRHQTQSSLIGRITQRIAPSRLLSVAGMCLTKECIAPSEEKVVQLLLQQVSERAEELHKTDPYATLSVLLSMNKAEPLNGFLVLEREIPEFLKRALSEFSGAEPQLEKSGATFLEAYARAHEAGLQKSNKLLSKAICNGISLLHEKHSDELLLGLLECIHGKEPVFLIVQLLKENGDSAALQMCWKHSQMRLTSINVKEHLIRTEDILKTGGGARCMQIVSKYLCNVLPAVPLTSQKAIVRDRRLARHLWDIIMCDYKSYEGAVLSGLTSSTTLHQTLSCEKTDYSSIDVAGVEGEAVMFLIMQILSTPYQLQYLQIITKMKILYTEMGVSAASKWAYMPEKKAFVYEGTPMSIAYELSGRIKELVDADGARLQSSTVYEIVQEHIIALLSKKNLREYAVHALVGGFIEKNPDLRMALELMRDKPRKVQAILDSYPKPSTELPCPSAEKTKRRAEEPVSRRERKKTQSFLTDAESVLEKEELRKTGILAAQLSISKNANAPKEESYIEYVDENEIARNPKEEKLKEKIQSALRPYSPEQLCVAAGYFFVELERYWKTDREKISSHFDRVIKIMQLFAKADGIEQMLPIMGGYINYSYALGSDASETLKEIVKAVLRKKPAEKAFSVLKKELKNKLIVQVYTDVLKEAPSETIQSVFDLEEPGSFLHQAAVKSIANRRNEAVYKTAIKAALAQMESSRNDDVLYGSLQLLREEYVNASTSEHAEEIVEHAVRLLRIRTKIDKAGAEALQILEHALFRCSYLLSQNSKDDIVCSIKYDLYHYKNLLLFYLNEIPINEFLEIIGRVNSPESKSIRPAIKKIVAEYNPGEKEGAAIFSTLIEQAKEGTNPDKFFIIGMLIETVGRYAQGAWITLFLKTAEVLANEEKPEVEERLLELLRKIVALSQARKKMKAIYKEWAESPKLGKLVRKIAPVFK